MGLGVNGCHSVTHLQCRKSMPLAPSCFLLYLTDLVCWWLSQVTHWKWRKSMPLTPTYKVSTRCYLLWMTRLGHHYLGLKWWWRVLWSRCWFSLVCRRFSSVTHDRLLPPPPPPPPSPPLELAPNVDGISSEFCQANTTFLLLSACAHLLHRLLWFGAPHGFFALIWKTIHVAYHPETDWGGGRVTEGFFQMLTLNPQSVNSKCSRPFSQPHLPQLPGLKMVRKGWILKN